VHLNLFLSMSAKVYLKTYFIPPIHSKCCSALCRVVVFVIFFVFPYLQYIFQKYKTLWHHNNSQHGTLQHAKLQDIVCQHKITDISQIIES